MQPELGNLGNFNLEALVLWKTEGGGPPENQENRVPEKTTRKPGKSK